jgi:hypothetical protein
MMFGSNLKRQIEHGCLVGAFGVVGQGSVNLVKRSENFLFPFKLFDILSFHQVYGSLPNKLQAQQQGI